MSSALLACMAIMINADPAEADRMDPAVRLALVEVTSTLQGRHVSLLIAGYYQRERREGQGRGAQAVQ